MAKNGKNGKKMKREREEEEKEKEEELGREGKIEERRREDVGTATSGGRA